MHSRVWVQEEGFDPGALQRELLGEEAREGAVVAFTGYVRDHNDGRSVQALTLEHYPGMTEASIEQIVAEAGRRWPLIAAAVVHRVGTLRTGEEIVWVGVSSSHREAAFSACEFVMDYLKTRAPFWKKEEGAGGSAWVESRDTDHQRARRWSPDSSD